MVDGQVKLKVGSSDGQNSLSFPAQLAFITRPLQIAHTY